MTMSFFTLYTNQIFKIINLKMDESLIDLFRQCDDYPGN